MRQTFKIISVISLLLLIVSCSNQKNTKKSRVYHEINTRYNIYFNAEMAYEDALKSKETAYEDNLSRMISMYPIYPENQQKLGTFETTIDKCVKAIKLHSIQAKPERNPNKRRDVNYQEWLKQKEFNPFLKNVWLLMAKAEYQSLDYVKAISTFSYISRLFKNDVEVVTEANLWIAMAYTQMGWIYEAESTFHKLKLAGEIPNSLKDMYAIAYANFLVRSKKYEEAVPYLQDAIKSSGGMESTRFKYLLAQIHAHLGNRQAAYDAFDKVQGLSTPYAYSLNSKLQQASFVDTNNSDATRKTLSSLKGMSGKVKNEEYLDQIFYAMGNIYWAKGDTANAVKNYSDAIEKSKRNGYDKAVVQVSLGDIYFDRKDYVKAQPLYPEALGVLGKDFERYAELSLRSEVLDELVVYAEALHLQDSLQTLARMPETERIAAIEKIIELQKKKDKEEEKERQTQEWRDQNEEERPDMVAGFPTGKRPGERQTTFYFYNKQTVAKGKTDFKKKWGNRKLEDLWRLSDKTLNPFSDDFLKDTTTEQLADSTDGDMPAANENASSAESTDKYSVEYYLAQLPLTPETMAQSDAIIEDAYFNMGLIYKNKLEDMSLSIEAFEMDLKRYPDTPNKEEIYYQLFLIYSRLNNKAMADVYRNKLLGEYPKGDYALTLSDPNYEWNMRNIGTIENDLYNATYSAYLANNIDLVRKNYSTAKEKYPLSKLMPKFMFVNALTYAQTNDPKAFSDNLKELVDKYPNSDVTALATDMLKGVQSGRALMAGGPMKGMVWDIAFAGEDFAGVDENVTFTDNKEDRHRVLLIFDPTKINRNDLLYDVADYNFSKFVLKTFDISFTELKPLEILQMQGFTSFNDIVDYTNKAFEDSALIARLDTSVIMLPISDGNYSVLNRGKSLGEYIEFVENTYSKELPRLLAYWRKEMKKAGNVSKEQPEKAEPIVQEKPVSEAVETEIPDINPDDITLTKKPTTSTPLKTEEIKPDEEKPEDGQVPVTGKKEGGVETIITDDMVNKAVNTARDVNETIDNIANNPVDGLKGLINQIGNKPKLTKEEKEAQKKEKEITKRQERERKAREKEINDSIRNVEKVRQDSINQAERDRIDMERAAEKAKEDAKKQALREREEARKDKERERKEKAEAQQQKLKDREREREERLKQREQERKDKQKAREQELKEKERERKEKLKQKEKEQREKERSARERNRGR